MIFLSNYVEKKFSDWTKLLNLDFDPNVAFVLKYLEYKNEFSSNIKTLLQSLFVQISNELPNVDFYIRGRFKSELSYLNKAFQKLNSNISSLFDVSISTEDKLASMEKYFEFLKNNNSKLYEKILLEYPKLSNKRDVQNPTELRKALQDFKNLISDLSKEELNTLMKRLGSTEDIFAYRIIVQSVRFNIKKIDCTKNGSFEIIDDAGNHIPISTSIKIRKSDIYTTQYGKKCINLNGTELVLNNRNFLYNPSIPPKSRTIENAKIDSKGFLTYLGDTLVLPSGESLDINSVFYSDEHNAYFFETNGETRNLSHLIESTPSVQLVKNDSTTCIEYTKKVKALSNVFLEKNGYEFLPDREKNYIDFPKPISHYQSLHSSFRNRTFAFDIEEQIRTLEMDDDSRTEKIPMGHNNYKRRKLAEKAKRRPILNAIKEKEPTAFDSSADTIMELLSSHSSEISLTEVLPSYILIGKFKDSVQSYVPELDIVFNHFFHSVPKKEKDLIKASKGISFDDYISYKQSCSTTQNTALKGR